MKIQHGPATVSVEARSQYVTVSSEMGRQTEAIEA